MMLMANVQYALTIVMEMMIDGICQMVTMMTCYDDGNYDYYNAGLQKAAQFTIF